METMIKSILAALLVTAVFSTGAQAAMMMHHKKMHHMMHKCGKHMEMMHGKCMPMMKK